MSKLENLIAEFCPNGVPYKALGELGYFYGGLSGKTKEDFTKGNAKLITYMNVYSNLAIDTDIKDWVRIGEEEKQNTVQYGDVLFTGSSETLEECGMSSVLTEQTGEKLYLNSFCFGFRFYDNTLLLPDFTKYLFRSKKVRQQIKATANGVTRFNVSKKKMEEVLIPLPPRPVQQEIFRILDCLTKAVTELTTELAAELAARKNQYEYYRDFLMTFDEEVEWKTLGEVAINHDAKRKPVPKEKRQAGKYPYYGASGIVDYVSAYIFDGDYLLVSEDGANLLSRVTPIAFSASGKIWVNNHAHVLEFKTYAERKFIEYFLNMIDLRRFISSAAQPKLTQENLNKIPVPDPPFPEKQRIVAILDRYEALYKDLASSIPAEIEARQKQYEYFRDKLLSFKELVK